MSVNLIKNDGIITMTLGTPCYNLLEKDSLIQELVNDPVKILKQNVQDAEMLYQEPLDDSFKSLRGANTVMCAPLNSDIHLLNPSEQISHNLDSTNEINYDNFEKNADIEEYEEHKDNNDPYSVKLLKHMENNPYVAFNECFAHACVLNRISGTNDAKWRDDASKIIVENLIKGENRKNTI